MFIMCISLSAISELKSLEPSLVIENQGWIESFAELCFLSSPQLKIILVPKWHISGSNILTACNSYTYLMRMGLGF